MKIYKKISVAASIIAVAMMTSCSDKGYWEEAPHEQAYYFMSATCNETLNTGANEIVIPIERIYTETTESINVEFTPGKDCPSDITVESPVTFEAGSNTANVVIKIAHAVPPYTYSGTLSFDAHKSYSGVSAVTFNCPVAYNWNSIGKGGFLDAWVMGNLEDMFEVEILKADGFERYRVIEPYKEYYTSTIGQEDWEDWISTTGPAYIEFWENAEGKLSFNSYNTGLLYQATPGQPIGAYSWSAFAADNGYTGDNDIWYRPGFAVLSPVYYINGVGGFGQQKYAVQIILP